MSKLLLAALVAVLSPLVPAQEIVAVKAGKVWLPGGKTLEGAVILIKDGRIEKIGPGLEVPWNAQVIEAEKHWVLPAWVEAHSSSGMDRENENMPVTPYLTVLDSLDPTSIYFENCRRYGIGTVQVLPGDNCVVGGRGMTLRPFGKTPEQMAIVERAGMKASLSASRGSRSQQLAQLVKAFEDARTYRAEFETRQKEFEEDKKNGATTKEKFDEEIDPLKQPLLDVLDGKITVWLNVPSASDVAPAIKVVESNKLKCVFVLGADCWKASDLLKQATQKGIGMVAAPELEVIEKDPVTSEETLVCPAKALYDAGIPFALTAMGPPGGGRGGRGNPFGPPAAQPHPATALPWWQVATCVRNGIPERAAVEAFTTVPAKLLGLEGRVGTIAEGMDGNLQILSAGLLEPECRVEYLLIEGKLVYDRSKDPRLLELTGKPKGRAAEQEEERR
jgi:imidazolonepropionase-like amidohydrolase